MADAEFTGAAPARARKKSPRKQFIRDLGRTLSAAHRLAATVPFGDPTVRSALRAWIADGEAVGIIAAARG